MRGKAKEEVGRKQRVASRGLGSIGLGAEGERRVDEIVAGDEGRLIGAIGEADGTLSILEYGILADGHG